MEDSKRSYLCCPSDQRSMILEFQKRTELSPRGMLLKISLTTNEDLIHIICLVLFVTKQQFSWFIYQINSVKFEKYF